MTIDDIKEVTEVAKDKLKENGDVYSKHILTYISYLEKQIEKMKCFIHSKFNFCAYCPKQEPCRKGEGLLCPYVDVTEEEEKEILMEFIDKWELAE